jgi:hypothetical protein
MKTEYLIGLDLGQSQDFTALAIVERKESQGDWDAVTYGYKTEVEVRLRYLERIPLGTSYPAIVERVSQVVNSPALAKGKRYLVVDATGVGRPVVDLLERAELPCKIWAVTITGGATEGMTKGTHRVPKRDLIVAVVVRFQEGKLEIAGGLREGETLTRELAEMRVQFTSGGREKYGAKSGEHDDLVIAVSLANWGVGKLEEKGTWGLVGEGRLV